MEKVIESERESLLLELHKFKTIRSIEIARSNIDRLALLVACAKKDLKIRELTLQNSRTLDDLHSCDICY